MAALFHLRTAPVGFGSLRTYDLTKPPAENSRMKHLLNGLAIAAVLAVTAPALAQAPTSGAPSAGSVAAPAGGQTAGHARTARPHRPHRRMRARQGAPRGVATARGYTTSSSPSDNVANQLNGQELQRLEGSSTPVGMTAPMAPPSVSQPGPRASSGTAFPAAGGPAGPVSMEPGAVEGGPRASGGGTIAAPTGPMPMPPPPPVSSPAR